MKQFNRNQKLLRLNYLLKNSNIKTIANSNSIIVPLVTSDLDDLQQNLVVASSFSVEKEKSTNFLDYSQKNSLQKQDFCKGLDMSKDLSLFLNLIEKPINLLFSIDQFVFEFSKKTYQQKKTGEFFQQLKERKKLSLFYGNLTRKQILNLFYKSQKAKGYFSRNVFSLLEKRLDVVLYRSGLTKTIAQARQLIKHKKILVNQKVINSPSFLLTPGDWISMNFKTREVCINQLRNSLKKKYIKNRPKILGDFYSKLKKTLVFFSREKKQATILREKSKQSKAKSLFENFQSKSICKGIIQLLCTKIKTRSFWNLKNQAFDLQQSNQICYKTLKKSTLTLFKWKSFSKKKQFFSIVVFRKTKDFPKTKFLEPTRSKSKKKNLEQNVYANQGCLQKKPVFWVFKKYFLKTNFSLFFQKKGTQKKNFKLLHLKKKNLELYRNSFLIFLKYLENYKKFSSLVYLNINKSFLSQSDAKKKSSLKQISVPFQIEKKFGTTKLVPKTRFLEKETSDVTHFSFRVIRPLNIEISYNLLNIVYLYSPQRINFPFFIDLDLISRSLS